MDITILVKIFATALALSEVTTQPQSVKTHFDAAQDQTAVVQILRDGCSHMKQAFDIESINLDDLISTAMDDPKAMGADIKAFHGINFNDLNAAYHQFCKNETIDKPVVDLGQVIDFYNSAAADLPDPNQLKGKKLPGTTIVLDGAGNEFADVFQPRNKRIWVPLADIPDNVQKAFVAAEDRRFYQHHGVDERGIIRAFIGNLADSGRPQGGSTITQQVVKNLLVGEDVTYERKIREMIVASRLETTLTKNEILELYLNSAYLGRGSWGVEMAARTYFGKSAKDLSVGEAAMLASMLKGPSFYNPDRHPDRARERITYVLGRMQEDGVITSAQKDQALAEPPKLIAYAHQHRDEGFHFVDFLGREARADGVANMTADSYTVHSTINASLQREVEASLQEGLSHYEISMGRVQFRGPEANIADAVQKITTKTSANTNPATANTPGTNAAPDASAALPAWQQALQHLSMPLYDVHWTPAVVLQKNDPIRVGLPDGRIMALTGVTGEARRSLGLYDVVYTKVVESRAARALAPPPKITETKNKTADAKNKNKPSAVPPPPPSLPIVGQAQLRVRPTVQGAALVLENKTGRILAMTGGFSYPLSQLNRSAFTKRQPGSAIKPLTYLTALQRGLQPNTLVLNQPITFPPIGTGLDSRDAMARQYDGRMRPEDYWSPRNADFSDGGALTMRRGLENSINIVTAHLLDGGIDGDPERSLDAICATAVAAKIYSQCERYYPFILGAQPVRMIDIIAFYAAVANEGARPQPHGIDSIELNGHPVYQYPDSPLPRIDAADATSFYQLKTMLQGVVARGTARGIGALSPYVAGKTGTTEDAVDGWFIGFTNDVTIAVWMGYDNGDGKRRSLGSSETGARVALPIFQPILETIWNEHIAPKAPLNGPSAEAKKLMVDIPIDYMSGTRIGSRQQQQQQSDGFGFFEQQQQPVQQGPTFVEHFRRSASGQVADTQYDLVNRDDPYLAQGPQAPNYDNGSLFGGGGGPTGQWIGRSYYPNQPQMPQPFRGIFGLFQPDPPPPPQPHYYGRRVN
ncbi:MAG TPA: transglycosylase domain-containing protein [Xanthobacteraceae bacterium]|jgi:membrane carboxypeptidase/penicillin-binding protein|nr:transglycosylase domain-containing protein [Xanthobacteraceae bacterium]